MVWNRINKSAVKVQHLSSISGPKFGFCGNGATEHADELVQAFGLTRLMQSMLYGASPTDVLLGLNKGELLNDLARKLLALW